MANPYFYKQPKYPTYDNSYYGGKKDKFRQQMPNPNAPSANGSVNSPDQSNSNWFQNQDVAGGVTAGLGAAVANGEPVGDFNIDQYAGFKGSGQGLMSGGVIGAIVGGVGAQFGQFSKVNKNLKNLQTGVEGTTFDANGRPVYQGGNLSSAMANSNELDKGIKKLNKTHLDPATNLISTFTGTRRKMKRKRAELQKSIQKAQSDYNQADISSRAQANNLEDYYQRNNSNSRMYNLYRNQI